MKRCRVGSSEIKPFLAPFQCLMDDYVDKQMGGEETFLSKVFFIKSKFGFIAGK